MPLNENSKHLLLNDSNIPIPKRSHIGFGNLKKTNKCRDLPELKKYIDKILICNNECNSKNKSTLEKSPVGGKVFHKGKSSCEAVKSRYEMLKRYSSPSYQTFKDRFNSLEIKDKRIMEDPHESGDSKLQNIKENNALAFGSVTGWESGTLPFSLTSKSSQSNNEESELSKVNKSRTVIKNKRGSDLASNNCVPISSTDSESSRGYYERKSKSKCNIESQSECSVKSNKQSDKLIRDSEDNSDCASGKLKFLTSDHVEGSLKSEESQISTSTDKYLLEVGSSDENAGKKDLKVNEKNTYRTEFDDMSKIYDLIQKTTESFLIFSSKCNKSEQHSLKNSKNNNLAQVLKQLNNGDSKVMETKLNQSDFPLRENCLSGNDLADKMNFREGNLTENFSHKNPTEYNYNEKNDSKKVEFDYCNINSNKNQMKKDRVFYKKREDYCRRLCLDDGKKFDREGITEDDNLFETSQKIKEVLKVMYNRIKKFNNEEKLKYELNKNRGKKYSSLNIEKKSSGRVLQEPPDTKQKKIKTLYFEKDYTNPVERLNEKKPVEEIYQIRSFTNFKSMQDGRFAGTSRIRTELTESNYSNRKTRGRRKYNPLDHLSRSVTVVEKELGQIMPQCSAITFSSVGGDPEVQATPRSDRVDVNPNENFQTVESQNELGGYSEEFLVPDSSISYTKAIFPLSVKIPKNTTSACQMIKNALEAEEKLLESGKTSQKRIRPLLKCNLSEKLLLNRGTPGFFLVNELKNFVILINPRPRYLSIDSTGKISFFPALAFSSTKESRNNHVKRIKSELQPLCIIPERCHYTLLHKYRYEETVLLNMCKITVAQSVKLESPLAISEAIKLEDCCFENSKCLIEYTFTPAKKMMTSETSSELYNDNRGQECTSSTQSCNLILFELTKDQNINDEVKERLSVGLSFEDKAVQAMREETGQADGIILVEENVKQTENDLQNCEAFSSGNKKLNKECEVEIDKKKICDLLLRTQNLQNKLERYLQGMTSSQPISLPCSLIEHEMLLDFEVSSQEKKPEVLPPKDIQLNPEISQSMVCWYLQPHTTHIKNLNEDEKINQGTSYHSQSEQNQTTTEKKTNDKDSKTEVLEEEIKVHESQESENGDDDRSSNYSFKSSNDFSESKETLDGGECKVSQPTSFTKDIKNIKFLRKIFSDLDLFKKYLKTNKKEDVSESEINIAKTEKDNENPEKENPETKMEVVEENKVTDLMSDAKTRAKVLKTVFRGKQSTTELTVGLKDVPMASIKNISVEKKKFSQNHTKISICISKEKSEEIIKSNQTDESISKTNNDIVQKDFSSYYFDSYRPALSTCQTEYSRLEDDMSKCTGSSGSDDEEDDFKSVASTFSCSDTEDIVEETKPEERSFRNEIQPPVRKVFPKHRFDFYQKMDMDISFDRKSLRQELTNNTMYRYKDLEPLQRALTEMQIRMRSIKRDSFFNSYEYYKKALKLAKMSAGFCQSCGNRAVIPEDTFGCYRSILPQELPSYSRNCYIKTSSTSTPNSSFYSFRTSNGDLSDRLRNQSSPYLLNKASYIPGTFVKNPISDMSIIW